jgi:hypothetical protein
MLLSSRAVPSRRESGVRCSQDGPSTKQTVRTTFLKRSVLVGAGETDHVPRRGCEHGEGGVRCSKRLSNNAPTLVCLFCSQIETRHLSSTSPPPFNMASEKVKLRSSDDEMFEVEKDVAECVLPPARLPHFGFG